jgi:hypothetical protein
MKSQHFPSGRLREIRFDPKDHHLELTWDNKTITAYRPVPQEVFERLCKAPSPATYFDDRIAEEYPMVTPKCKTDADGAAQRLKDLFGDA